MTVSAPRSPAAPDPSILGALGWRQIGDDAVVEDRLIEGAPAGPVSFDLVELAGCRVTASLADSSWRRADWANTVLDGVDAANAQLSEANLRRVALHRCRVTGLQLPGAQLSDVSLTECSGSMVNLRQSRLERVRVVGGQLDAIDLGEARLSDVEFVDCDLTAARFDNARVQRVRFVGCRLGLVGGLGSLRGAVIAGAEAEVLAPLLADALGLVLE